MQKFPFVLFAFALGCKSSTVAPVEIDADVPVVDGGVLDASPPDAAPDEDADVVPIGDTLSRARESGARFSSKSVMTGQLRRLPQLRDSWFAPPQKRPVLGGGHVRRRTSLALISAHGGFDS